MHSSLFLLLGLTISCSAQFPDLTAPLVEDPSTAVPQIIPPNNAETGVDRIGEGVGTVDSGSDSAEALTNSQTDDSQLCFINNKNQTPSKKRLRAREWCRNNEYDLSPKNPPATDTKPPATTQEGEPKDGSPADGNLNQPSGEQNTIERPGTGEPLDPYPCKKERTFAVCSPLQPTMTGFPLSVIWGTGLLEYCRLYSPVTPCVSQIGESLYCCRELKNMYPLPAGTPRLMQQLRSAYHKSGKDCEKLT